MKPWYILILLAVVGVALVNWIYQSTSTTTTPQTIPEKISTESSNGVKLVGELYRSTQSKAGVILFHMLGGSRKDWSGLIDQLVKNNLTVLAVDLRGHGESAGRDNEYQLMREDATKWLSYLSSIVGNQEIFLIGASIGANLVVETAKDSPTVKKVVLLSPGLDYRGINIERSISQIKIPILVITSKEDQYSFSSTRTLKEKNNSVEVVELENVGHGTRMLLADPNLAERITDWLLK